MLPSSKNPDKNLQEPQVISDNITKLIIYEPQGVINNIGEPVFRELQVIGNNIPELILREPQEIINNNINLQVNNIIVDSSGHFSGSISGTIDFTNPILKNSWSGGTVTGTVGPSVLSLADIEISHNAPKYVEKTRYMDVNEINFDGIGPSEHSAHIKFMERNLGVKVFYPVAPEGDQATRINGMEVIGLTSEENI